MLLGLQRWMIAMTQYRLLSRSPVLPETNAYAVLLIQLILEELGRLMNRTNAYFKKFNNHPGRF